MLNKNFVFHDGPTLRTAHSFKRGTENTGGGGENNFRSFATVIGSIIALESVCAVLALSRFDDVERNLKVLSRSSNYIVRALSRSSNYVVGQPHYLVPLNQVVYFPCMFGNYLGKCDFVPPWGFEAMIAAERNLCF